MGGGAAAAVPPAHHTPSPCFPQTHAIMGTNGSGKSTLSKVLVGHPDYEVTGGSATFKGADLLALVPEDRARAGVFLSFQSPTEIPGVSNTDFLRLASNAARKARGEPELDPLEFYAYVAPLVASLGMDPAFLNRDVNAGFSGGEKKRNEILQMAVLAPDVAILDEIDSGLDVDALRAVAKAVNGLARPDSATLMVTHYKVREARGGDRRGVAPRRNAGSQDSERPRHPPHPTPLPTAPARPRRPGPGARHARGAHHPLGRRGSRDDARGGRLRRRRPPRRRGGVGVRGQMGGRGEGGACKLPAGRAAGVRGRRAARARLAPPPLLASLDAHVHTRGAAAAPRPAHGPARRLTHTPRAPLLHPAAPPQSRSATLDGSSSIWVL